MGDFYQNGLVTTLHNLRMRTLEDLESNLKRFCLKRPIALVIPCLYSELETAALANIIDELQQVTYLKEVIIGLDRANKKQFAHAKQYFSRLPHHHRVIWNDGPRMKTIEKLLIDEKIAPRELGKGRNAWYSFGYLIASGKSEAIALHDADIITYDRSLLARLLFPVVNPTFNYKFCKGYYFRAGENKLNGRVSRLMITPLLRTLKKFFGNLQYLDYLDSFRYPLAGEFSMRADVVKTIRIPSDWGLEIGILSEVERNNSTNRICQVEIADRYDHKHQALSNDSQEAGLSKMTLDISKTIFRQLAANGIVFTEEALRAIKSTYYRIAQDFVEKYNDDAVMNGLSFDRHAEEFAVDIFSHNIFQAGNEFLSKMALPSYIPSWKRVISAIPDIMEKVYDAVEMDNE